MYPSVYELEKLVKIRYDELLTSAKDRAVVRSIEARNLGNKHDTRELVLGKALFGGKRQKAWNRTV